MGCERGGPFIGTEIELKDKERKRSRIKFTIKINRFIRKSIMQKNAYCFFISS
jgi:hypothetical protein